VGQSLARVELQVAGPRLFEGIPGLRLAVPDQELRYKDNQHHGTGPRLLFLFLCPVSPFLYVP
jgi:cytochrome P450